MRAAVSTSNLCANSIRVWHSFNSALNLVIEAWPSTASLKLAFRTVKRRTTPFADVSAAFPKRVILASEGHFRAFVADDAFLFSG
jgi:hypothetical protein